jgi:hypothetical protein
VGAEVDGDGAGKEEEVVFAGLDVYAVGVGEFEPAFADGGDGAVVAGEGEFTVEEAAIGLEVVGAGDVEGELGAEEGEEVLAEDADGRTASNFVRRAEGEELALNACDFLAGVVGDEKGLAEGEDFAVDVEDVAAELVLDGEVVAEGEDFFAEQVTHGRIPLSVSCDQATTLRYAPLVPSGRLLPHGREARTSASVGTGAEGRGCCVVCD